jgi:hypothetical protein
MTEMHVTASDLGQKQHPTGPRGGKSRRFRRMVSDFAGGLNRKPSRAEMMLLRRAVALLLRAEVMEAEARTIGDDENIVRLVNAAARLLQTLGIIRPERKLAAAPVGSTPLDALLAAEAAAESTP